MDPRISFNDVRRPKEEGRAPYVFALGREHKNMDEAEAYCAAAIERRERLMGRTLTAKEIANPPLRRGSVEDEYNYSNWLPTPVKIKSKPPIDDFPMESSHWTIDSEIRLIRNARKALAKDYRDAMAAKDDAPSNEITAEMQAARDWADLFYEQVAWNPQSTYAEFIEAEKIRRQSRECLDTFRTMADEAVVKQNIRIESKRVEVQAERAKVDTQLASLKPLEGFAQKIPGLAFGDRVFKLRDVEGNTSFRVVRGNEVRQQWSEADAPAEIVEAAQ